MELPIDLDSEMNDSYNYTEQGDNISRRRIAFKSQCPISQSNLTKCSGETLMRTAAPLLIGQSFSRKPTRKFDSWRNDETSAFFEGVKQYGKNFDQIVMNWPRKKRDQHKKVKEQIRNFYFNKLKRFRAIANLSEEDYATVPRDARELFILINGFEWTKKIGKRFDAISFRRLVIEGAITLRTGYKKQLVTIKTPVCPALKKFFANDCETSRQVAPSHINLYLTPKLQCDKLYVESCNQNPYIKIRLPSNERLTKIFEILKAKWSPKLNKQEKAENFSFPNLLLFPDESLNIAKVEVRCVSKNVSNTSSSSSSMTLSLQRLREEYDHVRMVKTANGDGVQKVDETKNSESSNSFSEFNSSFVSSIVEDNRSDIFSELVLNETILQRGLSHDNSLHATVMELFYLCGMKTDIPLLYSTNVDHKSFTEPWNIFITLVNQNFGESFCKYMHEIQQPTQSSQPTQSGMIGERNKEYLFGLQSPASSLQKSIEPSHSNYIVYNTPNRSFTDTFNTSKSSLSSSFNESRISLPSSTCSIVEEENDAFVEQFGNLKKLTKRFCAKSRCNAESATAASKSKTGIGTISSGKFLDSHPSELIHHPPPTNFSHLMPKVQRHEVTPMHSASLKPVSGTNNVRSRDDSRNTVNSSSPIKSNCSLPEEVQNCLDLMMCSNNSREFFDNFGFQKKDLISDSDDSLNFPNVFNH